MFMFLKRVYTMNSLEKLKKAFIEAVLEGVYDIQLTESSMSDEEQIEAIKKNPWYINSIENPSEDVQLALVKCAPGLIGEINTDNPSEAVQIAALQSAKEDKDYVGQVMHEIQRRFQPSEKVKWLAVKISPDAIEYIDNPSEELLQYAIQHGSVGAIKHIDNPPEEMQLAAVNKRGDFISYIKNPSEKVKWTAIKKDPFAITYFDNPSEEMQVEVAKNNVEALEDLYDKRGIKPSEAVQLAAVQGKSFGWGMMSWFYEMGLKPSEEVQLAAVKRNPETIEEIENPYPSVIEYVNKHK